MYSNTGFSDLSMKYKEETITREELERLRLKDLSSDLCQKAEVVPRYQHNFSDLLPGRAYSVRVSCFNEVGRSESSPMCGKMETRSRKVPDPPEVRLECVDYSFNTLDWLL